MASPYPWHYSLRWLYYYLRPSVRNHTGLGRLGLQHRIADATGEDTARLIFFGDLMCQRGDRIPEVDPRLAELLQSADLVIGNCEAPVVFADSRADARHLTHFGMAEEFLGGFLKALGVATDRCVLSVANNHIGDREAVGLGDTLRRLRNVGVTTIGDRPDPIVKVPCKGALLGFSAWTRWLNFEVFDEGQGVWRAPLESAKDWSTARAEAGVDALIATPHWEYEFQHFPRAETRDLARTLCASGVDLIVGHHPHVIQPVEVFDAGLCLYSIGNLNGPSYSHVAWPVQLGGFFEVEVQVSGAERGRAVSYAFHPFAQLIDADRSARLVPLDDAPKALHDKLRDRLGLLFDLTLVPD